MSNMNKDVSDIIRVSLSEFKKESHQSYKSYKV